MSGPPLGVVCRIRDIAAGNKSASLPVRSALDLIENARPRVGLEISERRIFLQLRAQLRRRSTNTQCSSTTLRGSFEVQGLMKARQVTSSP